MQRDRDVNKSGTPRNRFAARTIQMPARTATPLKMALDLESKPEKRDATTASAAKIIIRNRNFMDVVRAAAGTGRAALEDPITQFVVECQSLCHLALNIGRRNKAGLVFFAGTPKF